MTPPATQTSVLQRPFTVAGIAAGSLFMVVGIGMLAYADASQAPNFWDLLFDPETPGDGKHGALLFMGWAFLILGSLPVLLFGYQALRPIQVEHHSDESCPEIPRVATRGDGDALDSVLTHEIVGSAETGALQPRSNPHRRPSCSWPCSPRRSSPCSASW